jgi:putative transposase
MSGGTVLRNLQFRIYPNKQQELKLNLWLEKCCWLYNYFLEKRIKEYEENKKSLTFFDHCKEITLLKQRYPELKEMPLEVLRGAARRLDISYKNFFRRVKEGTEKPGFPKKKELDDYRSLLFLRENVCKVNQAQKKIRLPYLGDIYIVLDRNIILHAAAIKGCLIRKSRSGKWFINVFCELPVDELPDKTGKSVTITIEYPNKLKFSSGEVLELPLFYHQKEEYIKWIQKRMDNVKDQPDKWERQKINLAKAHERIAWRRKDFLHKLSKQITDEYDIINIQMEETRSYIKAHPDDAKKVMDAGIYNLVMMLKYKAESKGRKFVVSYLNQNNEQTTNEAEDKSTKKKKTKKKEEQQQEATT